MGVGNKIKSLRKSMGLTQTELGEKVGVKKNAVSKWECGRVEGIPISTVKALANLFGVSACYLIDDEIPESAFSIKMQIVSSTSQPEDSFEFREGEKALLLKFRDLDPRGRSAVMNVLEYEHNSRTEKNAAPSAKEA